MASLTRSSGAAGSFPKAVGGPSMPHASRIADKLPHRIGRGVYTLVPRTLR